MHLLVDEDSQARTLVRLLREAGHDVHTAAEAGLNSLDDREVFSREITDRRVLLTRNCGDFLLLHDESSEHSGILAVYQDADLSKSMSYSDIVRAINNVERCGLMVEQNFIVLNAWSW